LNPKATKKLKKATIKWLKKSLDYFETKLKPVVDSELK